MRVLDVVDTPNPNAMKFILESPVSTGTKSYFDAGMAKDDPLATRLFAIPGVKGVMLLGSFITITRSADTAWAQILDGVNKTLNAEH